MVVVVPVRADHTVDAGECFGKVIDDGKTYPFVGAAKRGDFVLSYGAFCKTKEIASLSIVSRRLRVGDLFTRVERHVGRPRRRVYMYRIESITPAVVGANPPTTGNRDHVSEYDVAVGMTLEEVLATTGAKNLGG